MNPPLIVKQAEQSDLNTLASMFDEYRQFYQQPSDVERCHSFLLDRLNNQQSTAFIALIGDSAAGFIHLYPSYSSVSLMPIWVLNDLYVRSFARRKGVGFALLDEAKRLAKASGAKNIQLATAQNNFAAQSVYESRGYIRDRTFYHYSLNTNTPD